MNRRHFLATPAATLLAAAPATGIIDTHVYLSRWPFRRLPGDDTAALIHRLQSKGVTSAWAASFDAVFHKDMTTVNASLAEACTGPLVPFGGVNPQLPDWEEDLRRCHEQWKMPGIRIYPAYHNYRLDDPLFDRLFRAATERRLLVQIAVWLEDERHQNPLMQIPAVDLAPLPALLEKLPTARVQLLNAYPHTPGRKLTDHPGLAYEFARQDGYADVRGFANKVGINRILFGSYSPMLNFTSALLKLKEAALTPEETTAVTRTNAARLLG